MTQHNQEAKPLVGPAPTLDPELLISWPTLPYRPDEERVPRLSFRQELLALLEAHITAEEKSVAAYAALAASGDPVLALLTGMLAKDEAEHHALLKSLAGRFSDSPYWKRMGKRLSAERKGEHYLEEREAEKIAAQLGEFLRGEKTGQRFLRQLAKRTRDEEGGLFAFLLEVMAMDSQKHERVLTFLIDHLMSPADPSTESHPTAANRLP